MIIRALDAGVPTRRAAGDEVYGHDPHLRTALQERGMGYELAISSNRRIRTPAGGYRADVLARMLPRRAWQRLSAGNGSKGHRYYDWTWVDIHPAAERMAEQPGHHWLLIRRNRRTGELAFYHCHAPRPVTLATLVRAAGRRWTVEQSCQTAKGQTGLDSTRSAPGPPGIGGRPWSCSRTSSSLSPP